MEGRRDAALAEIARDAELERSDFLVRAGEQLERFMSANAGRIRALGGVVLIDDDPEYLAVAADGTFRSRSRVFDEARGEWIAETEIIERAAELVEIYNPADILQAFAEAEAAAPAGEDGEVIPDGDATADPYVEVADQWAAGQPDVPEATDESSAARALYDLALDYQDRSQRTEAGLVEAFENAAGGLLGLVGTLVVVDDDDEHLALGVGGFRGRVIPEGGTGWQDISQPDQIVRFYDPTDIFGDLAEAIADAYPAVTSDDEDAAGDDDEDDDADDVEGEAADEADGDEAEGDEAEGEADDDFADVDGRERNA